MPYALCAVLFFPAAILAQTKAYQIGPGDVLTLTIIAGGETQREETVTVSAEGIINAPFLGPVKAKGLTPGQLAELIRKPLAKDYFVDPKVNISVKEYHAWHYYISGAVKSPGLYEMSKKANLLELIAKAGGVSENRGSVAYIIRGAAVKVQAGANIENLAKNSQRIKVDLLRLLTKADTSANPTLQPGDVVYIPPKESQDVAESQIYVEGEVKKPGSYDYQPGMTAMNACIVAGGFDKFAAPNRTRIIRKKGSDVEVIKINLNKVRDGKIPDVQLKPGDRVYVPETWL
jgi:polysaccharide export outer membrane protein